MNMEVAWGSWDWKEQGHRSACHCPTGEECSQLQYLLWGTEALRPGLLLLAPEQRNQSHTGDLDHLETDTGNITDGMTTATETGDQDLVLDSR